MKTAVGIDYSRARCCTVHQSDLDMWAIRARVRFKVPKHWNVLRPFNWLTGMNVLQRSKEHTRLFAWGRSSVRYLNLSPNSEPVEVGDLLEVVRGPNETWVRKVTLGR